MPTLGGYMSHVNEAMHPGGPRRRGRNRDRAKQARRSRKRNR